MQYRTLGKNKIRVSAISLGTWSFAGGLNWGTQDRNATIATLHSALDVGINFFDTAEVYGNGLAEQLIGEALYNKRDKIVIATKVSPEHCEPSALRTSCDRSLCNLRTDHIDLYQIHYPNLSVPFDDTFATLEALKQEGKIIEYGVSNFGYKSLKQILERQYVPVSNQLAYSLLFRAIEYEILPLCLQHSIPILCFSPLMHGLLTGKFNSPDTVPTGRARTRHFSSARIYTRHDEPGAEEETFSAIANIKQIALHLDVTPAVLSIAWLLAQPGVASVIVGARTPSQLKENISAAEINLSSDIIESLNRNTIRLKEKLGANADMWQTSSRVI